MPVSLAEFPRSNPNPIVRLDADGVITFANDASKGMLESLECEMGRRLPADALAKVFACLRESQGGSFELRCGEAIYSFICTRVAVDEIYVYGHDVTRRHAAEVQLRQAQKLNAIGQLAGGVAHDFNNVLMVILNCGDALARALPQGSAERRYADDVVAAAKRAAGLTRQLLSFSRRHDRYSPRRVLPEGVVAEVARMIRRLLGESIEYDVRSDHDVGAVLIDPVALEQVLVNLAVNARDAMSGAGRIVVATRNTEIVGRVRAVDGALIPAGSYVEIAVTDTGCGIDRALRSKIFEPFFTTKAPGEGTGLGLAMCYGIVRQSSGYLTLESEPGKGARFKLLFPRMREDVSAASIERSPALLSQSHGETILLVEDDRLVQRTTERMLRAVGYEVIVASDGLEALERCNQTGVRIDLVVTDVIMPKMGGLALVEELRGRHPGLGVLFTSGYAESALQVHAPVLSKPFSMGELADAVRHLLDDEPARASV